MIPVQLCVTARDGHGHLVSRRYIEQLSEAMLAPEFGSNIPAAILHKFYGIHDDEILSAAPFLCTVCGNKATALCQHAVRDVRSQTGSQAYTVSDQASAICDREGPCEYMVLVRDRQITQAKLESLAATHQELSKDDIVAAAKTDRMAADYAQLLQYCDNVGQNVYSGHLPIWTCCPGARPR